MSSAGNKWKDILYFRRDKQDSLVIYYVLILFVAKLLLLPYVQTVDADAVSRTLISYEWQKNPHFIWNSVWAPLHFYLNGIVIYLTGWVEDGPRLINIVLSCLTLVPLYGFVKREFSANGALMSVIVFSLSSVIFRNSLQGLSGTPYLFFVAMSLYYLSKALRDNSTSGFIISGSFISIAAGFRYEAWVLIAVFTLIGLFRKNWKGAIWFWVFAMIIPVCWMLVGKIFHNDFLYGLHGPQAWIDDTALRNVDIGDTERLKRLIFFPLSWFFILSPVIGLIINFTLVRAFVRKEFNKDQLIWLLPILIMDSVFLWKAQNGTLYLQHRFTASLIFFSIPVLAMVFKESTHQRLKLFLWSSIILMIPQFYLLNRLKWEDWTPLSRQFKSIAKEIQLSTGQELLPLPQLDNPLVIETAEKLESEMTESDGLIMDFIGWTETYYLALQYPDRAPLIFPDGDVNPFHLEKYEEYVKSFPKGKLLIHCATRHDKLVEVYTDRMVFIQNTPSYLKLDFISSNKGLLMFEYEARIKNEDVDSNVVAMSCFEKGSKAYFDAKVYLFVQKIVEGQRLMRDEGISMEKAMKQVAEIDWQKYQNGEIEL